MRLKNIKHKGFSLAEVLIAIGLLAVIAAIVTPCLEGFKPNKTKAMFNKTYQIAERTIYELVNDPTLYPDNGLEGFDNVGKIKYNGTEYSGVTKFANLFALKMNTLSDFVASYDTSINGFWTNNEELGSAQVSFVTTDGVIWALPSTNFTAGDSAKLAYKKILIDVNGNKRPNIMDSEDLSAVCDTNVDRFTLYVRTDGKLRIKGVCAREYLSEANMLDSDFHSSKSNTEMGESANGDVVEVVSDGPNHQGTANASDADDFDGETGLFCPQYPDSSNCTPPDPED